MDTQVLVILILVVAVCLAWFGFKILKKVFKVILLIVLAVALGYLVYHNFL